MIDFDAGTSLLSHCWQLIRDLGPDSAEAQNAFRSVFERWYMFIWLLSARNSTAAQQEEVRQATILSLWRALGALAAPLSNPARFIALLNARARATCLQADLVPAVASGARRGGTATLDAPAPQGRWLLELVEEVAATDPALRLAAGSDAARLWDVIRRLPLSLQDCVIYRRMLGLSVAETQVLLNLSAEQVNHNTELGNLLLLRLVGTDFAAR